MRALGLTLICAAATFLSLALYAKLSAAESDAAAVGHTEVLKWKDGNPAALALTFDDNLKSQKEIAIPELDKRGIKGTFFVNPGRGGFATDAFWQKTFPTLGHDYGVHTMKHQVDEATVDDDVAECARILRQLRPAGTTSPLMSFARPGGKDAWNVSKDLEREVLKKNQLLSRDTGGVLMYVSQDLTALDKWTDALIKSGGYNKVCFHGVGGDYIAIKRELFTDFLDHLVERKDKLWIAPHLSVEKYATEFSTAKAEPTKVSADRIVITLSSDADSALYDQPLTLRTRVPAAWKRCKVSQGSKQATSEVVDGIVRYEALPGGGAVTLEVQ